MLILALMYAICSQTAYANNYAQQLQRLSPDEGLSQGYVTDILQDDLGYVWIGTLQGLNRFDGYKVNILPAFGQYSIVLLKKTRDNKIFVSTEFSGAFIIDPITLAIEQIYSGKLNKEDRVFSPILAVAQDENAFYFAINHHVYFYNTTTKSMSREFSINKENHIVRALTVNNNYLYIGTSNGLYSKSIIDDYITKIPFLPDSKQNADNTNVKYLSIDKLFGLIIGTVEGLYSIDLIEGTKLDLANIKTLVNDNNIWDYTTTQYGDFIATESGLYQYHRQSGQKEQILKFDQSKFHFTDNTILKVLVDKSGYMWLASRSQGVFTWPTLARRFSNIQITNNGKLHNNVIYSVFQDEQNSIWLGTENGITHLDNDYKSTTFLDTNDEKAFYGEFSVYGVTNADLGEPTRYLWLMLYEGLALFDKQTKQLAPLPSQGLTKDVINQPGVYGFHQITTDTFAFFNSDNYYLYDGKTGKTRIIKGLRDLLDPDTAHAFLKPLSNVPDELLISVSGALYRYNETTQKLTLIYEVENYNPLTYVVTYDTVIDYNNTLWLASSHEGLIALDATTYEEKTRINFAQGINTKSIFALQIDQFGFLWASSQNGLYRVNLNSLQVNSYSVKDGLTVNEFNLDSHTLLNDGRIAFGTTLGLLTLAPQDFLSVPFSEGNLNTQITAIELFSRDLNYHPEQYENDVLQLSADDMGLEVSFSNFDFLNIDKTSYKVTLKGPTSFTYDKYKKNKIFFTKLPPGNYQLSIAAYFNNSNGMSKPTKLNFNVAYAPWRSPLALFVYGLISLSIVFIIVWQYRTKRNTIENSHKRVLQSQQQTDLALNSSNSGVWEVNLSTSSGTQNRLVQELGYQMTGHEVGFKEYGQLIHPDDKAHLIKAWDEFVSDNSNNQWQATYRLKHAKGHWLWYQDTGRVSQRNEQGEVTKVSGIYTNITQHRANAQLATVLGEAFSQINDWLLILDSNYQPISVNNSFSDAFSINSDADKLNIKRFLSALGKHQYVEYINVLKTLKAKENWRGDAYIKSKTNPAHPIHISITAIAKETKEISYYVIVISDLTEQKRAENELRYLANYDPLTKLPNRTLMYQKINKVIQHADKNGTLAALLFIDLDKFKPVNDSFGHAVGDQLLCNITQRVNNMLSKDSVLGRQSGDEFLLLIQNIKSPQSLSTLVKSVSEELGKRVEINDFAINISASIGVALYPFDADSADMLIRHSDIAMMHAKQAGRNGFKFFTEQMNDKITQKLLLENALKDAFKDDLLFNYYQPIVNNKTKKINAVELLMRWKHEGSFVSPAEFIPIAEEAGLIDVLTEQALDRALSELCSLLRSNPRFYLSLNLSPVHILKSNLSERLLLILARHHIKPSQLRLEITENTLLEDKEKASKQLHALRNAGFKLLLDDFGTGYSSLTYLSQFPIDVIKIDQSFVRNIGSDASNESIIKTIYLLAENLGLYCIAEGVETLEQIEFLNKLGCHDFQGYYFAKPMPASELLKESVLNQVLKQLDGI
ncbi:EAL domain-containing protein [Pseudoalteromonas atlantica]|uniref:EAL domain-containing protein n=1 Tax=Pseudoalteromonas atlantica TaxID=288 RepID=UPI00373667CA